MLLAEGTIFRSPCICNFVNKPHCSRTTICLIRFQIITAQMRAQCPMTAYTWALTQVVKPHPNSTAHAIKTYIVDKGPHTSACVLAALPTLCMIFENIASMVLYGALSQSPSPSRNSVGKLNKRQAPLLIHLIITVKLALSIPTGGYSTMIDGHVTTSG